MPRVASINASGHKYGLVYPGVGWIIWRDQDHLPEDLIFKVNYLGANLLLEDLRLHLRVLEHHPQTQMPPELQKKRASFAH